MTAEDTHCFLKYHDPLFFRALQKRLLDEEQVSEKADWTMPSAVEVKLNACHMGTLGKSMGKKKRESM